jgi:hypothetical protein
MRRQSDSHPLAQLERLVLSPMLPSAAAKGKVSASKGKGQKRKSGGTPAGAAAAAGTAGGGSGRGMLVVILDELDFLLTSAPLLHATGWLAARLLLLAGWLAGWLRGCCYWLAGWLAGCAAAAIGWLAGWLAARSAMLLCPFSWWAHSFEAPPTHTQTHPPSSRAWPSLQTPAGKPS